MDVRLIPGDPLGRAFTAGMFDGFVYLVDTRAGTAKKVFDCETIVPHIEVPVRGGMTQILAMPESGDRLIFALLPGRPGRHAGCERPGTSRAIGDRQPGRRRRAPRHRLD